MLHTSIVMFEILGTTDSLEKALEMRTAVERGFPHAAFESPMTMTDALLCIAEQPPSRSPFPHPSLPNAFAVPLGGKEGIGKVAVIDPEDAQFLFLSKDIPYIWFFSKNRVKVRLDDGSNRVHSVARLLFDLDRIDPHGTDFTVRTIDGNPLDLRRRNLRLVKNPDALPKDKAERRKALEELLAG